MAAAAAAAAAVLLKSKSDTDAENANAGAAAGNVSGILPDTGVDGKLGIQADDMSGDDDELSDDDDDDSEGDDKNENGSESGAGWDDDPLAFICELCKESMAVVSCASCDSKMCGACSNRVHRATASRHVVVPLNKKAIPVSSEAREAAEAVERAKRVKLFNLWREMEVEASADHILALRPDLHSEDIAMDPFRSISFDTIELFLFVPSQSSSIRMSVEYFMSFLAAPVESSSSQTDDNEIEALFGIVSTSQASCCPRLSRAFSETVLPLDATALWQ
jgi:hypothetical protein